MQLTSIEPTRSSQLAAAGFNPTADMPLRILFRRGGLYEYGQVSQAEYVAMMNAPRPGDFFRDVIKGKKPYRKVENEGMAAATPVEESAPKLVAEAESPAPAADLTVPAVAEKEQEVRGESTELVQQATQIAVTDVPTQEKASELLLTIASMRKKIADTWKPMKEAAHKAHKTICEKEKELDAPLAEAEQTLKTRISAFVAEQQRIAKEIEDENRRLAQERADAEAVAESERLALEDAEVLMSEGKPEEAEAVLSNPVPVAPKYVAPAPVAPQIAQVKGLTTVEVWKHRIINVDQIPREYMMPNESMIAAVISRTKGKIKIQGIEAYSETSTRRTGR